MGHAARCDAPQVGGDAGAGSATSFHWLAAQWVTRYQGYYRGLAVAGA